MPASIHTSPPPPRTPEPRRGRPPAFATKHLARAGTLGDGTLFNEARGHLLAGRLGGAGKGPFARQNLVTLTQNPVNSPLMRDLVEGEIYQAVKNGEIVQYSVTPIYEGANRIPIRLEFSAYGNKGFELSGFLDNPAAGVRIPG